MDLFDRLQRDLVCSHWNTIPQEYRAKFIESGSFEKGIDHQLDHLKKIVTWFGLFIGFYTPYIASFMITAIVFAAYAITLTVQKLRRDPRPEHGMSDAEKIDKKANNMRILIHRSFYKRRL